MHISTPQPANAVLERLREDTPLYAVELRPPKSDLSAAQSMDTWIDMYHSVRRLARGDTLIFLTDNAVGEAEEENLRHTEAARGHRVLERLHERRRQRWMQAAELEEQKFIDEIHLLRILRTREREEE